MLAEWTSRLQANCPSIQPLERGEAGVQAPCGPGIGREADELRPGHPADYAPYHQGIPPWRGRQLAERADRGIPPSQHQRKGRKQGRRIPAVISDTKIYRRDSACARQHEAPSGQSQQGAALRAFPARGHAPARIPPLHRLHHGR